MKKLYNKYGKNISQNLFCVGNLESVNRCTRRVRNCKRCVTGGGGKIQESEFILITFYTVLEWPLVVGVCFTSTILLYTNYFSIFLSLVQDSKSHLMLANQTSSIALRTKFRAKKATK